MVLLGHKNRHWARYGIHDIRRGREDNSFQKYTPTINYKAEYFLLLAVHDAFGIERLAFSTHLNAEYAYLPRAKAHKYS